MASKILRFTEKSVIDESIHEYASTSTSLKRGQILTAQVKLLSILSFKTCSHILAKVISSLKAA